jgi:signal transduction histidine kinase/DNA-binding response OmpR family regulator
VIAFVALLGVVSYIQTSRLFQQEQTLYEHPLRVKEAIDDIKIDILSTRVGIRDFVLAETDSKKQQAKYAVGLSLDDIQNQFDLLYELYLGPASDVDSAYTSFVTWKIATESRIESATPDNIQDTIKSLGDQGEVGILRIQLLSDIGVIDDFANNKTNELNTNFITYYQSLNTQRIALVAAILVISTLISIYLIQAIRKPLFELNHEIKQFRLGDLDARSHYSRDNEFGTLSSSFNAMADTIQLDLELSEKASGLSGVMLSQENAKSFFRYMLTELAKHLCADTAAVYLLSGDKDSFVCFDAIGLNREAREDFSAHMLEGEFGPVISTRKVRYIRQIPEDTKFRFLVANGQYTPREIMTIPIISGDEIIAIFSLTTIKEFYPHSMKLIESVIATMSARIEGILAFRTIQDMLITLEQQNRELDAQRSELAAQTTELTQQNIELDLQSSQLAEANRLKTSFLSNMSHELRTPLNSIIALSGVLSRRLANQIPEEELSYLEIVERNGKQLLSLINEILDISRIEAGREEVEITEFSLASIITEISAMLEPIATQKGIKIIWQEGNQGIRLQSDKDKCQHILQNIIGNAVKFTETGSVHISTRTNGNQLLISVVDTGIGIAKESLSTIFDEFKQADSTTSRKYGGTGLGLAIAKKYSELLGGSITVKSTVGIGTEFVISLPLYNGEAKHTSKTELLSDALPPTTIERCTEYGDGCDRKTILLIEDSEPAIIQIKDLLENSGHSILLARNASEALCLVEETIPDAIILDLLMPDIDGFQTLNLLRASERTADIPVLILTAKHITSEELGELKRNHIHQIVQKGDINRKEFLSIISKMLHPEAVEEIARPTSIIRNREKAIILIIEDNKDNMTTVEALLKDHYHILKAINGEQGIKITKQQLPDLILMDIALPGISGIDAFKEIRNTPSTHQIPVIALTASAMTQERATILAYGFEAFIAKPIHASDLLKAIGEVLYGK